MRVDNKPVDNNAIDTLAAGTRAGAAQKAGQQDARLSARAAGAQAGDQASLSSASDLVALAKNSTTAARQAKISALTEQVRAGSYQGDTGHAGQAMVQELLQSRTSATA